MKVLAQRVDALDRGQVRTWSTICAANLVPALSCWVACRKMGRLAHRWRHQGFDQPCAGRKVVAQLAQMVGGSGGGRPDMAEAGGKDASQLDAALRSAPRIVGSFLG